MALNVLYYALGRVLVWGFVICGLALPAHAGNRPGDVVGIVVECEYSFGVDGEPIWASGVGSVALASPVVTRHGCPVYLAQGWARDQTLAAGMVVRAFVWMDGQARLANGLQLSDGRVLVDGQVRERADP